MSSAVYASNRARALSDSDGGDAPVLHPTNQDSINIETLAAQIATAVQMPNAPSSLSMGSASILTSPASGSSNATGRQRSASNPPMKRTQSSTMFSKNVFTTWAGAPLTGSQSAKTSASPRSRSPRTSESSRNQQSARLAWLVGQTPTHENDSLSRQDTSSQTNRSPHEDNGLSELMYRGIRVKEVKTTLKTMVIPHEVHHPMPKVTLERPGFARISY